MSDSNPEQKKPKYPIKLDVEGVQFAVEPGVKEDGSEEAKRTARVIFEHVHKYEDQEQLQEAIDALKEKLDFLKLSKWEKIGGWLVTLLIVAPALGWLGKYLWFNFLGF